MARSEDTIMCDILPQGPLHQIRKQRQILPLSAMCLITKEIRPINDMCFVVQLLTTFLSRTCRIIQYVIHMRKWHPKYSVSLSAPITLPPSCLLPLATKQLTAKSELWKMSD